MNRDQARARLTLLCPVGSEPVLDLGDIESLLDMGRMVDEFDLEPTDTGWTPTYDAAYIIAQAWLVKATRLADRYLFMVGGKMFSRQQFYDHCMKLHYKFLMRSPLRAIQFGPVDRYNPLDRVPNNT